ncbi:MAG: triose-phosphate isomerase [Thermoplasmatales archaeon]|nr:triose-phosphate isomerase [Thermoplasmatales archaeon]
MIINLKGYEESLGANALVMARDCQEITEESGVLFAVCPPTVELGVIARSVDIPVIAQNADPKHFGPTTGWVTPASIKTAGGVATLINHAEHRVSNAVVGKTVGVCNSVPLESIVCAETPEMARAFASFEPTFVAVEPPELIGGDVSVTRNPQVIERTVEGVHAVDPNIGVICGAGIKTGLDVANALELGTCGVLVASGFVKAEDRKAALRELIKHI